MRCVTLTNSRAQVAMSEGYECNALPEAELARFLAKRPQTLGDTSRVGSGAPGQVSRQVGGGGVPDGSPSGRAGPVHSSGAGGAGA